jgi:hypothetical protein
VSEPVCWIMSCGEQNRESRAVTSACWRFELAVPFPFSLAYRELKKR